MKIFINLFEGLEWVKSKTKMQSACQKWQNAGKPSVLTSSQISKKIIHCILSREFWFKTLKLSLIRPWWSGMSRPDDQTCII